MTTDCDELERDISEAMTALHQARAAYDHSPNVERHTLTEMAERTVNDLLDMRAEMVKAERIVRA